MELFFSLLLAIVIAGVVYWLSTRDLRNQTRLLVEETTELNRMNRSTLRALANAGFIKIRERDGRVIEVIELRVNPAHVAVESYPANIRKGSDKQPKT